MQKACQTTFFCLNLLEKLCREFSMNVYTLFRYFFRIKSRRLRLAGLWLFHVTLLKERYPGFKLRVNYTVNEDNRRDLLQFDTVFADVPVDVVQIRPVQNLGDSDYRNFNLDAIARHYDEVFPPLVDFCRRRSIVLFCPLPGHLQALADDSHAESRPVQDYAYCYISPNCCWKSDFRYMEEDFEAYCRRRHTGRELWNAIWRKRKTAGTKWTTRALNYDVK